jgi:hypothetical protein
VLLQMIRSHRIPDKSLQEDGHLPHQSPFPTNNPFQTPPTTDVAAATPPHSATPLQSVHAAWLPMPPWPATSPQPIPTNESTESAAAPPAAPAAPLPQASGPAGAPSKGEVLAPAADDAAASDAHERRWCKRPFVMAMQGDCLPPRACDALTTVAKPPAKAPPMLVQLLLVHSASGILYSVTVAVAAPLLEPPARTPPSQGGSAGEAAPHSTSSALQDPQVAVREWWTEGAWAAGTGGRTIIAAQLTLSWVQPQLELQPWPVGHTPAAVPRAEEIKSQSALAMVKCPSWCAHLVVATSGTIVIFCRAGEVLVLKPFALVGSAASADWRSERGTVAAATASLGTRWAPLPWPRALPLVLRTAVDVPAAYCLEHVRRGAPAAGALAAAVPFEQSPDDVLPGLLLGARDGGVVLVERSAALIATATAVAGDGIIDLFGVCGAGCILASSGCATQPLFLLDGASGSPFELGPQVREACLAAGPLPNGRSVAVFTRHVVVYTAAGAHVDAARSSPYEPPVARVADEGRQVWVAAGEERIVLAAVAGGCVVALLAGAARERSLLALLCPSATSREAVRCGSGVEGRLGMKRGHCIGEAESWSPPPDCRGIDASEVCPFCFAVRVLLV